MGRLGKERSRQSGESVVNAGSACAAVAGANVEKTLHGLGYKFGG